MGGGGQVDFGILTQLAPLTLVLCVLVAILAGVIKGAIGFAMPLVMVSGISSLTDPKLALAGMLIAVVLSNMLQTFRTGIGPALSAVREFWRYLLMVCIAIFLSAQLVPYLSNQVFFLVLGVPVVALSVLQLFGLRMTVSPDHKNRMEWLLGVFSGILGGLAGTWGPTTVLYLLAINTPKAKQMIVQGVVYGAGSVVLLFAHLQSGVFNRETAPLSILLLPAALLGLWIGFQLQDRLDQQRFRRVTLIVLVVAGLNLLRKGLLG